MGDKKAALIVLLIVCFGLVSVGKITIVKPDSTDCVSFSSGVTLFSPLNTTYSSNFLNLNITFDQGAGLDCSLNCSIDGQDTSIIPVVPIDIGLHTKFQKSGFVKLPELSEGPHYLTIHVFCGLYDYQGAEPPGEPFTPTFPGSSNYTASWSHTIHFTINTSNTIPDSDPNWVEVAKFTGSNQVNQTPTFDCNHAEWRIRWKVNWSFEPNPSEFPMFFTFNVYDTQEELVDTYFDIFNTNGALNYNRTGSFWLFIDTMYVKNYEIIVEQNVDSIPEFSSAVFFGAIFVAGSTAFLFKKLGKHQNEKTN